MPIAELEVRKMKLMENLLECCEGEVKFPCQVYLAAVGCLVPNAPSEACCFQLAGVILMTHGNAHYKPAIQESQML